MEILSARGKPWQGPLIELDVLGDLQVLLEIPAGGPGGKSAETWINVSNVKPCHITREGKLLLILLP